MIFSLDVRRARKGDCFLLHFGTENEPGLVMVDGGPKAVYRPHLRPRLEEIKVARGLTDANSLFVDLLMVSHVDDDHIQGILDLTKEQIIARQSHQPQLLNVQSFWHNSFDQIIDHDPEELTSSMKSQFGAAALSGGELPDKERLEIEEESTEDQDVIVSGLKVLASIEQGFRLRQDSTALGFPLNPEFDGKLIIARKNEEPITIAQGLKFTVLGPMQPDLVALHKKHIAWLKDLKKKGKPLPQALAAYVDKSVPNLASIVVLAEFDGKLMLFTGDARGDKILKGLELVGLVAAGRNSKLEVDLLKVPHHGSANNLTTNFFERIVAKHYVFSGNGEHGNPGRESLQMLLDARGDDDYTIHITYPIDEIDAARKKAWQNEQIKQQNRKKKKPATKVRPNWSPKKHGLAAFLEDHKQFAKKISIVDQEKPHSINLMDDLGF